MTTILDPAFDADYNEEEDEDFVPDATELGEDDEDDGAVQRRLEQERLKKAIKHKSAPQHLDFFGPIFFPFFPSFPFIPFFHSFVSLVLLLHFFVLDCIGWTD